MSASTDERLSLLGYLELLPGTRQAAAADEAPQGCQAGLTLSSGISSSRDAI